MLQVPDEVRQKLSLYRQDHVLAWWDRLPDADRRGLLEQIRSLDFEQLRQLYTQRDKTYTLPPLDRIEPAPVIRMGAEAGEARRLGEDALRSGEVAALVVA